ncbi:MAG: hypothetical protein FJ012_08510, partial [Chloroflexi bacterium]|nr:hypothetical protein [Chloroflexota bacterium]
MRTRVRQLWFLPVILVLILSAVLVALPKGSVQAGLTDLPTPWTNFTWQPYLYNGNPVYDHESSADPSNGGTAVSPDQIDIASGATGLGPGTQPSVLLAYYDGGTPGDATYTDDFYGFRVRLNGDPQHGPSGGYISRHWCVLMDIDGDNYKEFVIDLAGDFSGSNPDRLYVFYNNDPVNTMNPATDEVAVFLAANNSHSPQTYNHTRVVIPATGGADPNEVWLDVQIPITALKNKSGVQQVYPSTLVRLFWSTSASNTDPLQKDWMLAPFSFGDPLNPYIEATKTDSLFTDADSNSVPSPGDTLLYTIVITNSGNLDATGVTFSDTPDANTTLVVGSVATTQGTVTSGNNSGDTTVGVNIGTLTRGGGSVAIAFMVTINSPFPPGVSQVANQGMVSGTNFITEPTDDPDTVADDDPTVTLVYTAAPAINILKTGTLDMTVVLPNDRADVGDKINYTFTVTNTGNVTLTNIYVTDPKVTVSGGPITLLPGASDSTTFTGSYTLTQADINAGQVDNTATATGKDPGNNDVTNTDDETVTIPQSPSISVVKNGTLDMTVVLPNDRADVGDKINYTFTVTNTGNVTLTNIYVTDPKVTVSGGPITLLPGASDSTTFTGSYTLTQADINAGQVDNTATATGKDPGNNDVTN